MPRQHNTQTRWLLPVDILPFYCFNPRPKKRNEQCHPFPSRSERDSHKWSRGLIDTRNENVTVVQATEAIDHSTNTARNTAVWLSSALTSSNDYFSPFTKRYPIPSMHRPTYKGRMHSRYQIASSTALSSFYIQDHKWQHGFDAILCSRHPYHPWYRNTGIIRQTPSQTWHPILLCCSLTLMHFLHLKTSSILPGTIQT